MKIEKLPSGSYRVQKMIQGKRYSFTFDHRPTQKDIALREAAIIGLGANEDMTFRQACERYLDMKKNVLKVNTYREYSGTVDRLSPWFVNMKISHIDQVAINKQINELAATRAPKTVRNYHGFISAILGTFKPQMNISTTLPLKVKNEPYIPTDEEVKMVLDELKGTQFYIPVVLASFGMRRGEICALEVSDIEGDVVHITKSLARDTDNNYVLDTPKTTESTRYIIIPMEIADMIREQGYVYRGHPNSITTKLIKVQKKLGIQRFSVQKLRHYFASTLSANNVPDVDIMALGGWETDFVMKRVYRHSKMKKEEQKRAAMANINNAIF